jgi:hypothetical protein
MLDDWESPTSTLERNAYDGNMFIIQIYPTSAVQTVYEFWTVILMLRIDWFEDFMILSVVHHPLNPLGCYTNDITYFSKGILELIVSC